MPATHYDVLGVPPTADAAAIRKAYLRASLRLHPDKNPGREEEAKAEFVQIGRAYETLRDPSTRAAYDAEVAGGRRFGTRPHQPQRPKYDGASAAQSATAGATAASGMGKPSKPQQQKEADEDDFGDYYQAKASYAYSKNLSFSMYAAMIEPGCAFKDLGMNDEAYEFFWETNLKF